jgi:hypothetical protein
MRAIVMASESLLADELEERIQLRVGARVRELRQAAGITAVVLAERTASPRVSCQRSKTARLPFQ